MKFCLLIGSLNVKQKCELWRDRLGYVHTICFGPPLNSRFSHQHRRPTPYPSTTTTTVSIRSSFRSTRSTTTQAAAEKAEAEEEEKKEKETPTTTTTSVFVACFKDRYGRLSVRYSSPSLQNQLSADTCKQYCRNFSFYFLQNRLVRQLFYFYLPLFGYIYSFCIFCNIVKNAIVEVALGVSARAFRSSAIDCSFKTFGQH